MAAYEYVNNEIFPSELTCPTGYSVLNPHT